MARMLFTLMLLTLCFFMGLTQTPTTTESVVAVTMRRAHKPLLPQQAAAAQIPSTFTSLLATDTATTTLTAGVRFTSTLIVNPALAQQ